MKYRPPIDCDENREDPDEYFGCWHIILASVLRCSTGLIKRLKSLQTKKFWKTVWTPVSCGVDGPRTAIKKERILHQLEQMKLELEILQKQIKKL